MIATLLLLAGLSGTRPPTPADNHTRLGLIGASELPSGGGCWYWPSAQRPSRGYLLVLADWKDMALVKVRGNPKRVYLMLADVQEHSQRTDRASVGDTRTQFWRGPELQVTLKLRVTFVCASTDEGCEVERYQGHLIVSSINGAYDIPIRGECGL